MRVLTVVGNRPQFVKAAAVSGKLRAEHAETLVHTGQHFDAALSEVFFRELELPEPDRQLAVSGGTNVSQMARMLGALEPVVEDVAPACVLVYGDTNSTLAGAMCAIGAGIPVVHVEAGMRSFDRRMPEETNRVLTDHLAALLLCSSPAAVENLRRESVVGAVELVGDVMVDVALAVQPRARRREDLVRRHGVVPGEYILITAHRAGNVDDPGRLSQLCDVLTSLPASALFPVHPRTLRRLEETGLLERLRAREGLVLTEPLGYIEFTAALCHARAVLTDSGGLQKEAYLARVPCVTLRPNTEWGETVATGWNVLADLDLEAVLAALARPAPDDHPQLYGDGCAAERIVAALGRFG